MDSPDSLEIKGAAPRARRLNVRAAIGISTVVGLAMLLIVYQVATRRPAGADGAGKTARFAPADQVGQGLLAKIPDALPPLPAPPTATPPAPGVGVPLVPPALPATAPAAPRAKSEDEVLAEAALMERRKAAEAARLADTSLDFVIGGHGQGGGGVAGGLRGLSGALPGGGSPIPPVPAVPAPGPPAGRAEGSPASGSGALADALTRAAGGQGQQSDPNRQSDKEAFLAKVAAQDTPYLSHVRKAAMSPYVMTSGTNIPAALIGGLNSDLPGEITAIVKENVYDSATGNYLLIPQGAKLFGRYDSAVTYGQQRANVAWLRIEFPDASTLDLDAMRGTDLGGYAGLSDQVENHYGRIITAAVLSSIFSAGVELSQLQQQNGLSTGITTQNQIGQTVGASVGQNVSELGAEITRKNVNIQPTIIIRNGYRFNVVVNRDIVFPEEYRD